MFFLVLESWFHYFFVHVEHSIFIIFLFRHITYCFFVLILEYHNMTSKTYLFVEIKIAPTWKLHFILNCKCVCRRQAGQRISCFAAHGHFLSEDLFPLPLYKQRQYNVLYTQRVRETLNGKGKMNRWYNPFSWRALRRLIKNVCLAFVSRVVCCPWSLHCVQQIMYRTMSSPTLAHSLYRLTQTYTCSKYHLTTPVFVCHAYIGFAVRYVL